MRRAREVGETRIYSKGGNNYYQLGPEQFTEVSDAWKNADAFWEGVGFFGEPTVIKLADVGVIELATAEAIALHRAAKKADADEDFTWTAP